MGFKLHAIHTACGIETKMLGVFSRLKMRLHAIHTACGIETASPSGDEHPLGNCMQFIPLAVLKQQCFATLLHLLGNCMQFIPLAVLKLKNLFQIFFFFFIACNSYRLRY